LAAVFPSEDAGAERWVFVRPGLERFVVDAAFAARVCGVLLCFDCFDFAVAMIEPPGLRHSKSRTNGEEEESSRDSGGFAPARARGRRWDLQSADRHDLGRYTLQMFLAGVTVPLKPARSRRFPMLAARLLGLVALMVVSAPASAQDVVFDHLACHPIKDTLPRGSVRADLFPSATARFPAASGCRVKLPAKLFCEDVQKRNVQPPAPLVVDGEQAHTYFCYAVACPRTTQAPDANGFDAMDQFGARRVYARRPRLLCAPAAVPTPVPTPTSGFCGDTFPQCNGDCYPSNDYACVPLGNQCACVFKTPKPTATPTPRGCGRDGNGVCGGDCGPFSMCFDFGFACGCEPPTPSPPPPTPTP
jgi:hypothetical protein